MAHLIVIANNKGGCGKTVTSCHLAEALGRAGKRVLLVDVDTQCNSTEVLLAPEEIIDKTLYDVLDPAAPCTDISQAIYTSKCPNVWVLPNIEETATLEPDLIKAGPDVFLQLRHSLRSYAHEHFDYVVMDTPPNLGTFVLCALNAADLVIIPVKASSVFSIKGMTRVTQVITKLRECGHPDLRFLRLLINEVDLRTSISRDLSDNLRSSFDEDLVFTTQIPINAAFAHAEASNTTLGNFNGSTPGARAFRKLAEELMQVLGTSEQEVCHAGT